MIVGQEVIIPIPKVRNTHPKVEINSVDVTERIVESAFIKPVTIGIGRFTLKMTNPKGLYSGSFAAGQNVKFYCDNTAGTTLQFWGIIDFVKDDMNKDGQFIEIEGRHRSYIVTETLVNYTTASKEISAILEELITTFLSGYGFTHTNVSTTSKSAPVTWNYRPFWDCVKELCDYTGFDCYVDNSLDFHFFAANSIYNTTEGIVEGQNFTETKGWGTDTYYEKTRVAAMGADDTGLPILYTAKSLTEGSTIRKIFVKSTSANSMSQVQALAEGSLTEVTDLPPQATLKCYGLEAINQGDNITVVIPRQYIVGVYKVLQITHLFKPWLCEVLIEKEEIGTAQLLRRRAQKEISIQQADNPYNMDYSYNMFFNDYTELSSYSNVSVFNGALKLSGTTGQAVSGVHNAPVSMTQLMLKVAGKDLDITTYRISCNGGSDWQTVSPNVLTTVNVSGPQLQVEINFASNTSNPAPTIEGIAVLYK